MGKRTRECYLCGEKYSYCPTCSQDRMKPTWMAEFHNENCKNIFDICTRFNMKLINKTEAQKALSACNLSNKEKFKDYVQRDLANIFAKDEEPKNKKSKKVETNTIDETVKETKSHEVVNKTENNK